MKLQRSEPASTWTHIVKSPFWSEAPLDVKHQLETQENSKGHHDIVKDFYVHTKGQIQ